MEYSTVLLVLLVLLGVALMLCAGWIRRRSLEQQEGKRAARAKPDRGPSPVQEIHGVPPESRVQAPPSSESRSSS